MAAQQQVLRVGLKCQGCGADLPPTRANRVPKWCSERCRKGQYAGTCVDCGAPTNGYNGRARAGERCLSCRATFDHETRYWTPERVIDALRAWAQELGRPPTAAEAHRAGCPVPQMTVHREFGSWNAGIAAAGFTPRGIGERNVSGYHWKATA